MAKTLVKNNAGPLYTIGEVAQQGGLSIETLRRMDKKGEFKPSATTPGGQRRYTPEDVGRLFDIRRERKPGGQRRCLTISFVNVKGGVGKSTLAITLAGALAQRGYRVLVIDADPQANATQGLGLDPEKTTPTMARVLLPEGDRDRLPLADVVRPSRTCTRACSWPPPTSTSPWSRGVCTGCRCSGRSCWMRPWTRSGPTTT